MRYTVVVEHGASSWGAHVPDLPGCAAVAETREGVIEAIRGALVLHVEGLRAEGIEVPQPMTEAEVIDIGAA